MLSPDLMYILVYDQQVNQDFLLLFGAETATKLLEKWDTSFKPKVIKEAKHLTQSTDLCHLLNAAKKLAENDDNGTQYSKAHDFKLKGSFILGITEKCMCLKKKMYLICF